MYGRIISTPLKHLPHIENPKRMRSKVY